jgi:hypothetical protein
MAFAGLKKPKDRNDLITLGLSLPPVNALYADCLLFSFFSSSRNSYLKESTVRILLVVALRLLTLFDYFPKH